MNRRALGVVIAVVVGAGCGPESALNRPDAGTGGAIGSGGGGGKDASPGNGGTGGDVTGGAGGAAGAAGAGDGGAGGVDAGIDMSSSGGAPGTGGDMGAGGAPVDAGIDMPPLVGITCPAVISGSLDTTDPQQTGRESRISPAAACGAFKGYPSNQADPSNPHLYDLYHFINPTSSPLCFNFTLSYDETNMIQRYMTAYSYSTYDPTNIGTGYLGDVGATLMSPQAMGIEIPAGTGIDVVVFAIDPAPGGTGAYTLNCDNGLPGAGGAGGGGGTDGGAGGGGGADAGSGADGSDSSTGSGGAGGGAVDGSDDTASDASTSG
jgi:hypothetical protein